MCFALPRSEEGGCNCSGKHFPRHTRSWDELLMSLHLWLYFFSHCEMRTSVCNEIENKRWCLAGKGSFASTKGTAAFFSCPSRCIHWLVSDKSIDRWCGLLRSLVLNSNTSHVLTYTKCLYTPCASVSLSQLGKITLLYCKWIL